MWKKSRFQKACSVSCAWTHSDNVYNIAMMYSSPCILVFHVTGVYQTQWFGTSAVVFGENADHEQTEAKKCRACTFLLCLCIIEVTGRILNASGQETSIGHLVSEISEGLYTQTRKRTHSKLITYLSFKL